MPWASMSEVIVSAPTQIIRAGQTSAASVSCVMPSATSTPRAIWGDRAAVHGRRFGQRHGRLAEGRRDAAVGIRSDDDDGCRATRPGDVDEPADAGESLDVGEGRLGGCGEDHRGDGPTRRC